MSEEIRDKCRIVEVDGTAGTLQVGGKGSWAYLGAIIVGTPIAAAVVTVYEGQDATGTVRMTIDATTAKNVEIRARFKNGFYITVTGGAAKTSVVFA